jgi:hypothetical protein
MTDRSVVLKNRAKTPSAAALLALLALASFDSVACRQFPPRVEPSLGELARTADLVAIVHIERIRPLSSEDEALTERLLSDPPIGVPVVFPTTSAEFSMVRVLKGKLPPQPSVRNGATNCDVVLTAGHDYVIFAEMSDAQDSEIVPLYGTFRLDDNPYGLSRLSEVESSLTPSNQITP